MAKIRKQILGKISGAIGDVLFRVRNGIAYVGTKPSPYPPSMDIKSVNRRQRFALANKFAKSVNNIMPLKSIWKINKLPTQSVYNNIMKRNYHNVAPDDILDTITLVPEVGFSVNVTDVTISQEEIEVTIEAIGENSGIDPVAEPKIQLALVSFFKSPLNDNLSQYEFMPLLSPELTTSLTAQLTFTIKISDQQAQIFSSYLTNKKFFAIVTLDIDKKVIHYSNTYKG